MYAIAVSILKFDRIVDRMPLLCHFGILCAKLAREIDTFGLALGDVNYLKEVRSLRIPDSRRGFPMSAQHHFASESEVYLQASALQVQRATLDRCY